MSFLKSIKRVVYFVKIDCEFINSLFIFYVINFSVIFFIAEKRRKLQNKQQIMVKGINHGILLFYGKSLFLTLSFSVTVRKVRTLFQKKANKYKFFSLVENGDLFVQASITSKEIHKSRI